MARHRTHNRGLEPELKLLQNRGGQRHPRTGGRVAAGHRGVIPLWATDEERFHSSIPRRTPATRMEALFVCRPQRDHATMSCGDSTTCSRVTLTPAIL